MKSLLINKVLIVVTTILLFVSNTIAQDYSDTIIKVVRGIQRVYSLPENNELSYFWSYKDEDGVITPIEGDLHKVTFAFPKEGKYSICVYGKSKETYCLSQSTNLNILVLNAGFDVDLGRDRSVCEGDTIEVIAEITEKNIEGNYDKLIYDWSRVDTHSSSIKVSESGTYQVKVTDKYGNSVYDIVNIDVISSPSIDLGDDIIIEKGKIIALSVNDVFDKYEWSTGDEEDIINVYKHGKYWVTVTDINKCTASDTISVFYEGESSISGFVASLPTAFSPNGDGVNDILKVRGDLDRIKELIYIIYRKDGLKIFETSNINQGWNGKYDGEDVEIDGYIYFLKVIFDNEDVLTKKGSVSLLR